MTQAQTQPKAIETTETEGQTELQRLLAQSKGFRMEALHSEDRILAFLDRPEIMQTIANGFPDPELTEGERAAKARRLVEECRIVVANADARKLKPRLLACTVESYVQAMSSCASVDLSLSKALSQACLVPYGACVTFQIMSQGFVELLMRTGAVSSIQTGVVYQGEYNDFVCIAGQPIIHRERADCARDDAHIVAFYAEGRMVSGPPVHELMSKTDAEKIKRVSKDPGGPWTHWYSEQGRKSALRRMAKSLPKGQNAAALTALTRALELDNKDYDLDAAEAGRAVREHGRSIREAAAKTQVAPSPPPAVSTVANQTPPGSTIAPPADPPPAQPPPATVGTAYSLWCQFARAAAENDPEAWTCLADKASTGRAFKAYVESLMGRDLPDRSPEWPAEAVEAAMADLNTRGDPRPVDQREASEPTGAEEAKP